MHPSSSLEMIACEGITACAVYEVSTCRYVGCYLSSVDIISFAIYSRMIRAPVVAVIGIDIKLDDCL